MKNKIPEKSVFLVDGSSFLYRAYYGLRELHTSKGLAVHAVYGFCRMIKKLIDTYNVGHVLLVWDSKGKTERHELHPAYKETRQAAPSDLFEQKKYIEEFARLVGIEQLSKIGVEADDLMYSFAKKANQYGYQAVIVSSDKDMRQALSEKIIILDPFLDTVIDIDSCREKYGFEVEKIPFYFSMLGDSSDNIPGVKGIGKKGATDLVNQFDSLEDLYNNLESVQKDRTKMLLREGKDNAFLSKELFLLKKHSVDVTVKDTEFDEKNWSKALPLFEDLEFKSFIKSIEKQYGVASTKKEAKKTIQLEEKYDFVLIDTEEALEGLAKNLKKVKSFALDTETTGLNPMEAKLVGISIAYKEGQAFYIPFAHQSESQLSLLDGASSSSKRQLQKAMVVEYLKDVFVSSSIEKYIHNAKYDQLVLLQEDFPVKGLIFDTMIAASLVINDWEKKGLKDLSVQFFDEHMASYQDVVKEHKAKDFSYVPLQDATNYAAADAHQTLKLAGVLKKELKSKKLEKLFYDIEQPVNDILVAMQQEGIYCDVEVLQEIEKSLSADLKKIEKQIYKIVDKEINLNSPKQVKELLFDTLKLSPQKKSAKGTTFSTDAQVLKKLAKDHPVPGKILKYRELFKLKSTYVEALPGYINSKTNRIHTSWNQTLVATGRLSSSNPNLQNIPKNGSGYEVDVRSAFKARRGWSFISADYSQVELRILAYFSQDKNLVDAFLENKDIHAQTAAKLFDVAEEKVSSAQRDIGKRINFSILYGLTAYGLSRDLEISFSDAKKYIDVYFEQYPGVAKWMEDIVEKTKKDGYTETLYGRRRYLPGIHERNKNLFDLAKRIAINTPAQGTAAELTKLGMLAFQDVVKKKKLQAKILLQIHDELLVACPNDEVEQTEKLLKKSLESVVSWEIPLLVSTKSGKSWHDVSK